MLVLVADVNVLWFVLGSFLSSSGRQDMGGIGKSENVL